MSRSPLRILLLCNDRWDQAQCLNDHIAAFLQYSSHGITVFNPRQGLHSPAFSFDGFDVVVVHFTLWLAYDGHVPDHIFERLSAFRGLKVQFRQDEYVEVDLTVERMAAAGIHVVYSVAPESSFRLLYHHAAMQHVRLRPALTGYVPERLEALPRRPMADRPIDLGYRAREIDWWLGRLGQEKVWIADEVNARAPGLGLVCDISSRYEDRIYGEDWLNFVGSCRATLASESGASIVDFDGSIRQAVLEYRSANPTASWTDVDRHILSPHEGKVPYNALSPRLFEAAALGTGLVMFPGHYSGVVEAWTHYIPLEKDYANLDEVGRLVRDNAFMTAMAERAHDHLIASKRYSYRNFIATFDDEVRTDYCDFIGALPERSASATRIWTNGQRRWGGALLQRDRLHRHVRYQAARIGRLVDFIRRALAEPLARPLFWAAPSRAGSVMLDTGRLLSARETHPLALTLENGLTLSPAAEVKPLPLKEEDIAAHLASPLFPGLFWRSSDRAASRPAALPDSEYFFSGLSTVGKTVPGMVARLLLRLTAGQPDA